jgi:FGGY-family pentulose kinase
MSEFIVAVDVGTASARAGVFTLDGRQVARAVAPIRILEPENGHFEQVSDEIWDAVCACVRQALGAAEAAPDDVRAIGFDATCSLVVRDAAGDPVCVSAGGSGQADTLLWMDHRAIAEAEEASIADDPLVARFGGRLSPEMQLPKLLWLKRHLPAQWARATQIFDLCDYLTWRATGDNARSHSSLSSKWGYAPEAPGDRPDAFYAHIGLADLAERAGLPARSHPTAERLGTLRPEARAALGIGAECVVAPGLIDAYAGAIGVFCGADFSMLEQKAALVAGTSSCIVTFSNHEVNSPGCWGGFRDAALPGLWLMEAGQSASGALLDHILRMHAAGGEPARALHLDVLNHIAARVAEEGLGYGLPIAVLPDVHGSRSPLADPSLTGILAGISLDRSFDGLAKIYWRACVALACGIRHILQNMPAGERIETLLMTGGFAGHSLVPQLYADVTGRRIHLHEGRDAVLLGTAVNAGLAAGLYRDIADASGRMAPASKTVFPRADASREHERDYRLYLAQLRHQAELASIINQPHG